AAIAHRRPGLPASAIPSAAHAASATTASAPCPKRDTRLKSASVSPSSSGLFTDRRRRCSRKRGTAMKGTVGTTSTSAMTRSAKRVRFQSEPAIRASYVRGDALVPVDAELDRVDDEIVGRGARVQANASEARIVAGLDVAGVIDGRPGVRPDIADRIRWTRVV